MDGRTPAEPKPPAALTPTQRKMLVVLADGFAHRQEELVACLENGEGHSGNISCHLNAIRKVLREQGEDVAVQIVDRQTWYCHVVFRRSNRE